jgi:hypothetical protein
VRPEGRPVSAPPGDGQARRAGPHEMGETADQQVEGRVGAPHALRGLHPAPGGARMLVLLGKRDGAAGRLHAVQQVHRPTDGDRGKRDRQQEDDKRQNSGSSDHGFQTLTVTTRLQEGPGGFARATITTGPATDYHKTGRGSMQSTERQRIDTEPAAAATAGGAAASCGPPAPRSSSTRASSRAIYAPETWFFKTGPDPFQFFPVCAILRRSGALVKRLSRHPFKVKATGSNPVRPIERQQKPPAEAGAFPFSGFPRRFRAATAAAGGRGCA